MIIFSSLKSNFFCSKNTNIGYISGCVSTARMFQIFILFNPGLFISLSLIINTSEPIELYGGFYISELGYLRTPYLIHHILLLFNVVHYLSTICRHLCFYTMYEMFFSKIFLDRFFF